jgi:hypothetical protein
MNTLTGIEAERVSSILRHAMDRLRVLAYLPTEWDDTIMEEVRQRRHKSNCRPRRRTHRQAASYSFSPNRTSAKNEYHVWLYAISCFVGRPCLSR